MAAPDPVQPCHCHFCSRNPDEGLYRGAAVFGEGGLQINKIVYLFEPYSIHADLCLAVAIVRDFVLASAGDTFHVRSVNQRHQFAIIASLARLQDSRAKHAIRRAI